MENGERHLTDGVTERRFKFLRANGLAIGSFGVFIAALVGLVPTVGDFGLTWDEPAYRYSQVMSVQWWEQLNKVRSWSDLHEVMDSEALLYLWPYGRFGINFHPPLAGQLNLATYELFGRWVKDIPARRLATVIEFAATITMGFHFLARRYGVLVGLVMAGSLLCMPRLYGQAHLIDTDVPGLLLWVATALAFWKGLHEQSARKWRVMVGVLLGLAFVEKMNAVMVLVPLLGWLLIRYLARGWRRSGAREAWIDGVLTTGAMLVPLGAAFQQILILQRQLPPPGMTNLLVHRPASDLVGLILAVPLCVWIFRRMLAWLWPMSKRWGVERPGLEIWTAILAFAPFFGWLGNPAWWRETLPRLAHYYTLNLDRDTVLPPIQIIYFGQIYEFSLPWHNGWVLMAITVPSVILVAGMIGVLWGLARVSRDRLPLFFLVLMAVLPAIRMLNTPAHDGVRLFLPSFFCLAAFAGWGTKAAADWGSGMARVRIGTMGSILGVLVVGSAAASLVRVHPYELSYYNELIGGTRKAWERGFELTYWYDAYTPRVIGELNAKLPRGAAIDFLNDHTKSAGQVFQELQMLGELRPDIVLSRVGEAFPYVWLLTQDSKATAFTRLLFGMRPWYANEPAQLDGARVATVNDPIAVSRAWALFVLLDTGDRSPRDKPAAPEWVRNCVPFLGRFWGDGLLRVRRLAVNAAVLDWSRRDPSGLLTAARAVASGEALVEGGLGDRLMKMMTFDPLAAGREIRQELARQLLSARPQALVDAVQILNRHRDEVVYVMTRYQYTDPTLVGGFLDRDLALTETEVQR